MKTCLSAFAPEVKTSMPCLPRPLLPWQRPSSSTRVVAAPMETRGALAVYDRGSDLLTVWCSAQDPHRQREQLAEALQRPEASIRVIIPDVGGAFGSKGSLAVEVAVTAFAAVKLGKPVRWTEDRLEKFSRRAAGSRH